VLTLSEGVCYKYNRRAQQTILSKVIQVSMGKQCWLPVWDKLQFSTLS